MEIHLLQKEIAFNRCEDSYKKLFVMFYDKLLSFALTYVKQKEMAEEIVSDVMMKTWSMKDNLINIENLKVYLYTATKNMALNYIQRNKKYMYTEINDASTSQFIEYNNPEHISITMELKSQIQEAINNLPPKCQMAYILVKQDGCTYKETAQIMSVSENTVDRHICIAVRKLSEMVKIYLK